LEGYKMAIEDTITTLENLTRKPQETSPTTEEITKKGLSRINEKEYHIGIFDTSLYTKNHKIPFILTNEIAAIVESVCSNTNNRKDIAERLFHWVTNNIEYGENKSKSPYRSSIEVFNDREGVCGEMSNLYLVMVRYAGINGSFAEVNVDYKGEKVNHACAMIDVPGKHFNFTLVDPAYKEYDIKHLKFKPFTDLKLVKHFNSI